MTPFQFIRYKISGLQESRVFSNGFTSYALEMDSITVPELNSERKGFVLLKFL